MGAWNELLEEFRSLPTDEARGSWLQSQMTEALTVIGSLRAPTDGQPRQVLSYMSGYLQRPDATPESIQISSEDLNGLMGVIFGMQWDRGLTLILHTPGGSIAATQTIVQYLRSKFDYLEVIVPAYAMSGGTMISLASDRIVMGKPSQLGPIDPQMGGRSAQAIVDQFEAAKAAILGYEENGTHVPGNVQAAHLWAPLLQSMGPALLQEARNSLAYGEQMVAQWLASYELLKPGFDPAAVAHYFSDAGTHKNHGRRIDVEEATAQGLTIDLLEDNQDLQEAVLTAYHVQTLMFEHSNVTKALSTDHGRRWVRNFPRTIPTLV